MQKTKILWVRNTDDTQGYTINPIKGWCNHECDKGDKSWLYQPKVFDAIVKLKKPSTIFVGSAHDIFGDWIDSSTMVDLIQRLKKTAWVHNHTFLFLTKNPKRYAQFQLLYPFWLGATVTNTPQVANLSAFNNIFISGYHKYISFEPLLEDLSDKLNERILRVIDWFIIGCLNVNGKPVPASKGGTKLEWVLKLLEVADRHSIPVFIKPELYRLYPELPVRLYLPYL
jgi:protein gp37